MQIQTQIQTTQATTTQAKKTHWPSIIILAILAIGILFFLGISFIMSMASIAQLFDDSSGLADNMIIAFAAGSEGILLLACAWFVLQKSMGSESAAVSVKFPFAVWQVFAIPLIALVAISLGAAVALYANRYLSWAILPLATLLVIIPPIFLFLGIGSNGIDAGPRWRVWGILGLGLTVGPIMMIVIELLVLALAGVGVVVFLSFQPEKLQELRDFTQVLNNQTSPEVALNMLAPYLSDPRVIAVVLGYIALIVPLIEEMLKPLAVWIFARSIEKPSQGFVLGMLSGGAFAMMESLNASANGSEAWPAVVGVRAGTSLLHIMLSGLMGYAIVGAFQEKRFGRLLVTYGTVVIIHGIWNACAVGAGLSANGEALGKPEWITTYLLASIAGIMVLSAGMFVVLIASNRKLRSAITLPPVPVPLEDKE
jgi:hypothetical protein